MERNENKKLTLSDDKRKLKEPSIIKLGNE